MTEFDNLTAFITHFSTVPLQVQQNTHHSLEHLAGLIERTAKEELGHYQPAVGPYPAWAKLAESTLQHHKAMGVGESPLLVTGELYASIEKEVHGAQAEIGSRLAIAGYQEFGTTKIPPRPFMGPAAARNIGEIDRVFGESMVAGIAGNAVKF